MSNPPSSASPSQQKSILPVSPPQDPSDVGTRPKPPSHQHQLPVSPPLSTSPSQADLSRPPSPQTSVYTPTSAPPMSAEPSQQGSTLSAAPSEPHISKRSSDPTEHSLLNTNEDSGIRTASKRKLEDEEPSDDSHKRRRTDHDRETTVKDEPQNDAVDDSVLGHFFRPSSQPVPPSKPRITQNLIDLYHLNPLQASVARKDPITGEKINKLRKSYEGKIKDLPGRNKAIAKENEFFQILNYPDEEWDIQRVQGKEIPNGLSSDGRNLSEDLNSRLSIALSMASGTLPNPEKDKWKNLINFESAQPKSTNLQTQAASKSDKAGSSNQNGIQAQEAKRDLRRGTKRSYQDESFEGYDESFDMAPEDSSMVDDDAERKSSVGGSTLKKKRRKVGSASPTPSLKSPTSPVSTKSASPSSAPSRRGTQAGRDGVGKLKGGKTGGKTTSKRK